MTEIPQIECAPWTFRVSPFPPGTDAGRFWTVWIKATGDGHWWVMEGYNAMPETYLTVDGVWAMDREADMKFEDLDQAKRAGSAAILDITVNGITIQQAAERFSRGRS